MFIFIRFMSVVTIYCSAIAFLEFVTIRLYKRCDGILLFSSGIPCTVDYPLIRAKYER